MARGQSGRPVYAISTIHIEDLQFSKSMKLINIVNIITNIHKFDLDDTTLDITFGGKRVARVAKGGRITYFLADPLKRFP